MKRFAALLMVIVLLCPIPASAQDLDMELGALEAADRGGVATAGMLIRSAEIYVRLGLAAEADAPLNKALAIDPFNVKAETRLAMLELIRGKPDRAEKHIRTYRQNDRCLRSTPTSALRMDVPLDCLLLRLLFCNRSAYWRGRFLDCVYNFTTCPLFCQGLIRQLF